MKKIFFWICVLVPLGGYATQVRSVTAETTHMSPEVLKQQFKLKPGDLFSEKTFEQAKLELESKPIFRKLEFLSHEHQDGIDIHIKADDKSYIVPMFLGLSGNKHAVGFSVGMENVFKHAEDVSLFVGGGRDGFDTHGNLAVNKHSLGAGYRHINFRQRIYQSGWNSHKDIFTTADDMDKYNGKLLADIHGQQDDFYISYQYQLSSLWKVNITPEYEYYAYKHHALDSGNHSHIAVGFVYADHISPSMNIRGINGMEHIHKAAILRDLPSVQQGKTASITYTTGGTWTGSDYTIQKLALEGSYQWELKAHHVIALFAKGQRAFSAPFSNQIESSDLLFGMGIYDRQQRGKAGFSFGMSLTYFLLRTEKNLLTVAPFYEQAYITSGPHGYQAHSGIGATVTYRWWPVPLPIIVNFTHNLNDGHQHVGCKVGGKF